MRARLACSARVDARAPARRRRGAPPAVEGTDGPSVLLDGRPVLNFVSASYLGLDHGAWLAREVGRRPDWPLSLSAPRGLAVDADSERLEAAVAGLVGTPAALVAASTLHLLVDAVRVLSKRGGTVLYDDRCYPLSLTAVAVARGLGRRVAPFAHFDPAALRAGLRRCPAGSRVVLCDGVALPGRIAPVADLARACEEEGALLVLDDTQAVGLFGERPRPGAAYGSGGGGTARHAGCRSSALVVVASLAKAFGVPIAFAAGQREVMARLRERAEFVWTSSPPDIVSVRAALAALEVNAASGDVLRERLAANVADLRASAATWGRASFPVQTWYLASERAARRAHRALLERGVWAVLHPSPSEAPDRAAIRFLVTAAHTEPMLARATAAMRVVRREVPGW